jgi:tight adherence protein B
MSWNISDEVIFIVMVFVAVFLLVQSFMVPVFGENRRARKRLKKRLRSMEGMTSQGSQVSLVRRKYLHELSPWSAGWRPCPGCSAWSG